MPHPSSAFLTASGAFSVDTAFLRREPLVLGVAFALGVGEGALHAHAGEELGRAALPVGEACHGGVHARSAVGTNALPLNVAVEVEAVVEVEA